MRYTLIIGTKNWSSWSLRAWLALKATGAPFEEKTIALRQGDTKVAAQAASPSSLVPALAVEGDGPSYCVWDSLAIGEYLAERHPDGALWPSDIRARAEARSLCAEMHAGFAELRRQYPMIFAETMPGIAPSPGTAAAIGRIVQIWREARAAHGGAGPYLFGHFTIADCFYAPIVSRFRSYGVMLQGAERLYAETLWAHPAMQEWLKGAEAELASGLPRAGTDAA